MKNIQKVSITKTNGKESAVEVTYILCLVESKELFCGKNLPMEIAEFIFNAERCETVNNGIDTVDTYYRK